MRYLFLCACLLVGGAHASVMEVRAEPGADARLVAEVQKAMDAYGDIIKDELGLTLNKSALVIICPTEKCYFDKLGDFGLTGADRDKTARLTNGIADDERRRILVKLTSPSLLGMANRLVARTLTYFLQSELAAGSTSRTSPWIQEGMADFVGALVAQKLRTQSFDKWKLEVVNSLRRARGYPMPEDLAGISYRDWRVLMDKTQGKNYLMADLMMAYLYELKGRALFGEMAAYYRCLGGALNWEKTCFTQHFGIAPDIFYPQVQAWVKTTLADGGGVEVVAVGQDALASEIGKVYEQAQKQLEQLVGRKLGITMRIQLGVDEQDTVWQVVDELGVSEEEAAQRVKQGWFWQDSLIFMDPTRINTPVKRAEAIGSLIMGRYLQLQAGNLDQMHWLFRGLRYWMAEQVLNAQGFQAPADAEQRRLAVLVKAKKALPALTSLSTAAGWNSAVKKYGTDVVRQYTMAAMQSLLHKRDGAVIALWLDASQKHRDASVAFTQVFGESPYGFASRFSVE